MRAFHNDLLIKKKYLDRVKSHRLADELIKGRTGKDSKGCAVWCTLDKYDHAAYEEELGIPEWLARVEDCIFEGLPEKRSQTWPEEFLEAIKPGKDLAQIEAPFVIFILEGNLEQFDNKKYPDIVKATKDIIELYKKGDLYSSASRNVAWSAAWSASRRAAESAAWSVAWSVAWSASSSTSSSTSRNVARSVAWSAAWSASRRAAESAAYIKFAEKLLDLIKECK